MLELNNPLGTEPVRLFTESLPGVPLVLVLTGPGDGGELRRELAARTEKPCHLALVPVEDWDDQLSPWHAENFYGGGRSFGGHGDETIRCLSEEILPALRRETDEPDSPAYLAGYSLGGLCAVYALFRTAAFQGAVSASGSLWFPGFREFAETHSPIVPPRRVYFSLGDRESRTRNPVMRPVEDVTRSLSGRMAELGAETVFELNPGGHFQDPAGRLARGLAWLLG